MRPPLYLAGYLFRALGAVLFVNIILGYQFHLVVPLDYLIYNEDLLSKALGLIMLVSFTLGLLSSLLLMRLLPSARWMLTALWLLSFISIQYSWLGIPHEWMLAVVDIDYLSHFTQASNLLLLIAVFIYFSMSKRLTLQQESL